MTNLPFVVVGLGLALSEETVAFAVRELQLDRDAVRDGDSVGELLVETVFEGPTVEVMLPLWVDEHELVMDHETLALTEGLPLPLAARELLRLCEMLEVVEASTSP